MRRQRFDCVLDLQSLARSGFVAWLAQADRVIGLADPREGAPMFYDQALPRPSPTTHAVDWYLQAVRALGLQVDYNFTWLPIRPAVAAAVQAKWQMAGRRWVLLQPGARWHNKRWPIDSYAQVARELGKADPDLHFAVLGSEEERELGAHIFNAWPKRTTDLTGQLSLPELIEWLRVSALLITNDSGPMHLAAAVGTPIVALFGPTSPQRTGPYGQAEHVLQLQLPCVPCLKSRCHQTNYMECLTQLPVENVVKVAWKRLNEGEQTRPPWA
jgi:lipopolysaccharide heptosyltransferase II